MSKYCSDACRKVGLRQIRKQWEARTGYTEKEREKNAQRRAAAAAKRREDAAERETVQAQARKRSADQAKADKARRAASGDPVARMLQSKVSGDWREYWTAFKEYEIQYAEKNGKKSTRSVNGISIHDPDFVGLVLVATARDQKIYSTLNDQ